MAEKYIMEQLDDHEGRIRTLEKDVTQTSTTLQMTNKLLGAIAVMIGGGIVSLIFALVTHQIKIGG